jgi:P-type Ca2+ transporter type 2C
VQGDIVLLEAGDKIPADGRLLKSIGLESDESALTGESVPVSKQIDALQPDVPLAERSNMLFMNNVVTRGRGEMLVTATGMNTEIGKLAQLLSETQEQATPLQNQLDRLGKRLAALALVIVLILFASALWRGEPLIETAFTAIALAVAAIPEGLPAVVTVTLALGMHRMARQKAIVKRLSAVETLGCTTVICTDKTGTLTVNQMTVREFFYHGGHHYVSGEGYDPKGEISPPLAAKNDLLLPLILCNDSHNRAQEVIGDPMEAALLVLAEKSGVNYENVRMEYPRLAEIPFDAQHKFMATFHKQGGNVLVFVKGAPEVLLERCHLGCTGTRKFTRSKCEHGKTRAARFGNCCA